MTPHDAYWHGYRHGRRTAEHSDLADREPALRLELKLLGTSNRAHRAFALGELRGYRHAMDRPHPIVEAHRVMS